MQIENKGHLWSAVVKNVNLHGSSLRWLAKRLHLKHAEATLKPQKVRDNYVIVTPARL